MVTDAENFRVNLIYEWNVELLPRPINNQP